MYNFCAYYYLYVNCNPCDILLLFIFMLILIHVISCYLAKLPFCLIPFSGGIQWLYSFVEFVYREIFHNICNAVTELQVALFFIYFCKTQFLSCLWNKCNMFSLWIKHGDLGGMQNRHQRTFHVQVISIYLLQPLMFDGDVHPAKVIGYQKQ